MLGWTCRNQTLQFNRRPWVMGIVNTTPDSFSDGGQFSTVDRAVEHGLKLIAEGAEILDIGGESTRPGAQAVTAEEELDRVLPVVEQLVKQTNTLISIDTTKAAVAKACLEAGASIINDVSAATFDAQMVEVVREYQAGLVLMHMQGTPRTMQLKPVYQDVVKTVQEYLKSRISQLVASGIHHSQIVIDPGIGFGKKTEHNLQLIRQLDTFSSLGCPVLLGVSRKRFIGEITGKDVRERTAGSLAVACLVATANSAQILRVHDVAPTVDALKVLSAISGPFPV